MAGLKQYDASQVSLIMGGIIIDGFAEDTMVKITPNTDAFNLKIGVTGTGTRSKSNDSSYKISFFLQSSSASNDALSALHILDKASKSGDGIVPLLIKDGSGTHKAVAKTAWVVTDPEVEHGREASQREWVIETDNLKQFVGGN